LLPLMKRTLTISLDFDWVYRRLILSLINRLISLLSHLNTALRNISSRVFSIIWSYIGKHHGPEGMLARTWPTGSVVTWVVVLLTVFLLFSIY
jgi:multicomponent Na+:H+ antiporter subunit D